MKEYLDVAKKYFNKYQDKIKIAALPLIVVMAILFFWFQGSGSKEMTVENPGAETQQAEEALSASEASAQVSHVYVDISGAVAKPGVYKVDSGTRLFQVIEMAGGPTGDAVMDNINQAKEVFDGEKVVIPTPETMDQLGTVSQGAPSGVQGGAAAAGTNSKGEDMVNINSADSATLQTLPGIGPAKAGAIITYRQENGPFKAIEDIKNISGIGNKTFEAIKEYLAIN